MSFGDENKDIYIYIYIVDAYGSSNPGLDQSPDNFHVHKTLVVVKNTFK